MTRWLVAIVFAAGLVLAAPHAPAADAGRNAQAVQAPSLFNPRLRLDAPDTRNLGIIRFLTSDDYPPFNFALPDGTLAGYNVDLARAVCEELKIACTIQARRFDTLLDALDASNGDAVIAAVAVDGATQARADFSLPYFPTPARFVARRGAAAADPTPESLAGRTVGTVTGSAHAAFLTAFFPNVVQKSFDSVAALEDALAKAEIDLAFGDAADLGFWLNGGRSRDCCQFAGGPWLARSYFGEGHAVAMRRGDNNLRRAVNWALTQLNARGTLTELYLRYFPLPLM
jgi:polar amino acid transport system substrate-binding protein